MSKPHGSHSAEVEALERALERERPVAVVRLRAAQERWARAVLGIDDEDDLVPAVRAIAERGPPSDRARDAARHLADAERWQWEIGTWATGSGEGLSSMFEVRSLQLAQAWLVSVVAAGDPTAAAEVQRLVEAVATDPNDVAARHRDHVTALMDRTSGLVGWFG